MDPIKRPTRYQDLSNPQARPRYTGIPTFFRAPCTESLADTDIGIIGVPYDGGVTNRTGARHGPRAVRDQSSLLRRLHPTTKLAPFDAAISRHHPGRGARPDSPGPRQGSLLRAAAA